MTVHVSRHVRTCVECRAINEFSPKEKSVWFGKDWSFVREGLEFPSDRIEVSFGRKYQARRSEICFDLDRLFILYYLGWIAVGRFPDLTKHGQQNQDGDKSQDAYGEPPRDRDPVSVASQPVEQDGVGDG